MNEFYGLINYPSYRETFLRFQWKELRGGGGGGLSNGSRNGFIGEMEEDGGTFRELKVETASIFAPQ